MKIPPKSKQDSWLSDLVTKCFLSVNDRKPYYDKFRRYYLFGCDEPTDTGVPYNMLSELVETLHSFIFAGETTTFAIEAETDDAPSYERYMEMAEKVADSLRTDWHDADIDDVCGLAVEWSIVLSSMVLKLLWQNDTYHAYLIWPDDIGVLNESVREFDRQEIIVQRYWQSKYVFERDIAGLEKADEIMARVIVSGASHETQQSDMPAGPRRIITAGQIPNVQGSIQNSALMDVFEHPTISEDTIEMYEAWVYDDSLKDYRKFSMAAPDVILFDSPAEIAYVKGEHPYVKFTPIALPKYIWGYPELLRLIPLQDWLTERLIDIKQMLGKAVDPATAGYGVEGLFDEKAEILRKVNERGGRLKFVDPSGKIQEFKPDIPEDVFKEVDMIISYAKNIMGIQDIMQGKGTSGVRSRGQTELLSQFGSSRLKKKANRNEDSVERIGDLMLKLKKRYDSQVFFLDADGEKFTAKQLPVKCNVKIDAHSSSPIFVNEQTDMAFKLAETPANGVIDAETLVDLLRIPMKQYIKYKVKKRQVQQEKQAEQAQQARLTSMQGRK